MEQRKTSVPLKTELLAIVSNVVWTFENSRMITDSVHAEGISVEIIAGEKGAER